MTRGTLRMTLVSVLLAGGAGAVAPAATAGEVSGWGTRITLSVVPEKGSPGDPRTAVLTCDPISDPTPHARLACDELALVNGNVARVPARPMFCLAVWLPVTVSASGTWRGATIAPFSQIITNDGCARIRYGHVFDF